MIKKLSYKELEEKISNIQTELETKEKEINSILASFLSNISHDIRNPMNVIVGFSNLLSSPNFSQQQKDFFTEEINKSSDKLLRLIDNYILSAKIETNELKINKEELNPSEIMNEVLDYFHNKKQDSLHNNISYQELKINKLKDFKILTDRGIIKKAIINLVEHAKPDIRTSISIGFDIENGNSIVFFVGFVPLVQTGRDMKPDDENKFKFSEFHEESAISSFAITDKLIRKLGSKLQIKTNFGKESTFSFSLPLLLK